MMVETLVTIDQSGNVKPLLADKWDVAADGKSITFTLHPGIKFQDGTPLNAAAVKFSLERLCCDSKTFKPQPGILSSDQRLVGAEMFTAATAVPSSPNTGAAMVMSPR